MVTLTSLENSFAQHFHGVQTTAPSSAPDNPVLLPQAVLIHHNRLGTIRPGRAEWVGLNPRVEIGHED